MIVLQTQGNIKKFFGRTPGDVVYVTYGIPGMIEGAEEQKWGLADAARGSLRIDGVRYEHFGNAGAGRVARLRGMLGNLSVVLSAYQNYKTAVIVVDNS